MVPADYDVEISSKGIAKFSQNQLQYWIATESSSTYGAPMNKDILWVERYRPSTVEDLILPEGIKNTFREIIGGDKIPNLILSGSACLVKLKYFIVLCKELNCDLFDDQWI